jgi:hypothetical protein
MPGIRVFQSAFVGVAVVAGVVAGLAPAANATAAGVASAGFANVVDNGQTVTIPPIAQCSVTGKKQSTSNGATKKGVVTFGKATSTCMANATQHTSTSTSNGTNFTLTALQAYGGPTIKMTTYQVSCAATTKGTNASWQFGGLSGITVPQQIPNDYKIAVKSKKGALLANVTLNEVVLPNPNDGSITLRLMHIKLFPNGVPAGTTPMSGDIFVGSTACSPTA